MKIRKLFPSTAILFFTLNYSAAQITFQRTYGGSGSESAASVQQMSDSGCIIAGWTNSYGVGGDVYLIKTNAYGDTLWTRTFGGSGHDVAISLQQTTDGGFVITGWYTVFFYKDVYLIKTNATGDLLWERTFGGSNDDIGYSVQQTNDGGYVIVGFKQFVGVYLIKTNAVGDTLWTRTLGGVGGLSVRQTSDGGYVISGVSDSGVYLIKTNAVGDTLWTL
jgi:hypothetical protein